VAGSHPASPPVAPAGLVSIKPAGRVPGSRDDLPYPYHWQSWRTAMRPCDELRKKLEEFEAETLPRRDQERLERHAESCPACLRMLEEGLKLHLATFMTQELSEALRLVGPPIDDKPKERKKTLARRPVARRWILRLVHWGAAAAILAAISFLYGVQVGSGNTGSDDRKDRKEPAVAATDMVAPLVYSRREGDAAPSGTNPVTVATPPREEQRQANAGGGPAPVPGKTPAQPAGRTPGQGSGPGPAAAATAPGIEVSHSPQRVASLLYARLTARVFAAVEESRAARGAHLELSRQVFELSKKMIAEKDPSVRLQGLNLLVRTGCFKTLVDAKELSGADAEKLVATLLAVMRDDDWPVRIAAARALCMAEQRNGRVAADLFRVALRHDNSAVRTFAFATLDALGKEDDAAVPLLVEALALRTGGYADKLPVAESLCSSLVSLVHKGLVRNITPDLLSKTPLFDVYRDALKHGDCPVRERAVADLRALGKECRGPFAGPGGAAAPDAVSAVVTLFAESLPGQPASVARRIVDGLGDIGPAARRAAPALVEALANQDPGVRVAAARALCRTGYERPEAPVAVLCESLRSGSAKVRRGAASSLTEWGPRAAAAVPTLAERLRDGREDRVVQHCCLRSLRAIGPDSNPALPVLLEILRAGESRSRELAAEAVGAIGAGAKSAAPALVAAIRDDDPGVRVAVARALWRVDGSRVEESVAAFVEVLGGRAKGGPGERISSRASEAAAAALGEVGPPARGAEQVLIEALCNDDAGVRIAAALALWLVDGGRAEELRPTEEVLTVLSGALKSQDKAARVAGASALDEIGPAARPVAPDLAGLLKDPSPDVRLAADRALRRIEPLAPTPPGPER
jgi:HEAT repeat protein